VVSVVARQALVRVLFVALLALLATAASAHASTEPPAPPELQVSSALFLPARRDGGITWSARWVLTPESAASLAEDGPRVLRFAVPLADGDSVEPAFGVAPLVEADRVVGVVVARDGADGRVVRAVVRQRASGGLAPLGAPLAAGSALQIVDADLGGGTRLEVEAVGALERRVGFVAPRAASAAAQKDARRLTGYTAHVTGAAVYVRGDDARAAGGLRARVVTPEARAQGGALAVGALFAALVAVLVVAARRLAMKASEERADAVLAAELDALPDDDLTGRPALCESREAAWSSSRR
jgi:hypothetical protein